MRWIRDPQQMRMFDPFPGVLAEMALRDGSPTRLGRGQGVFRAVVLQLLPVGPLARHFSADTVFLSRSRGVSDQGVVFDGRAGVLGGLL